MSEIFAQYLLARPLSRLALVLVVVVGFLVAGPIARRLHWNVWGTRVALWGLGGALIPTFVYRIGTFDAGIDLGAADTCLSSVSDVWLDANSIANALLLVPFAVGLLVASRSWLLTVGSVVALGLAIEVGQQITRLGACERGDLIRNVGGALIAVGVTELVLRATRRPTPVAAAVPHRS